METIKIRIPLNITIPVSDSMAVEQMNAAINKLIKVGGLKGDPSDFVINYEIKNYDAENCVVVEINKENLVDTAHLQTVAGGLCLVDDDNFNWLDRKVPLPKTFSVSTIQERLRVSKRNPRQRFQLVIRDYQNWWKRAKDNVTKEEVQKVVTIFLSDLMQMFNELLPEIQEGKQLQSLLGTNTVSTKLNQSAKQLSLAYRRALVQEEKQGAPSKNIYMNLSKYYREFINNLLPEVFPGIDEIIGNKESEKTGEVKNEEPKETITVHSYKRLKDGRIDLFSGHKIFKYNILKDGRIDLFSRSSLELKKDEDLQNKIFEELKKRVGDEALKKWTFDEIYIAVMREFWKRKRYK